MIYQLVFDICFWCRFDINSTSHFSLGEYFLAGSRFIDSISMDRFLGKIDVSKLMFLKNRLFEHRCSFVNIAHL